VHTATGERDEGGRGDFYAVHHAWTQRLRSNITAVYTRDSDSKALDVDILAAFYKGMVLHTETPPRVLDAKTEYLLFFDGGSRGNPGAGGSGSVIVRVRDEPELVWAGSMSYARSTTTNNVAEYQGLCTGLDAAARQGWAPIEVVGDSMMIIRQMRTRTRPKAQTLRPLYEKARSIADALRIRRWHHHYRTHNKMADKAANQAMDSGSSYQARAQDGRPELEELREWLSNDITQWLQSRIDDRTRR
jgi:ribonuclease HI